MIYENKSLPIELKQGLIIPCILLLLTIFMAITATPANADTTETVIKKCSILLNNCTFK
jgi:hypothetical protein